MNSTPNLKAPPLAMTLTGADDSTEPLWLWKLAADYPVVEWGILYSQSRQGTGRYPSYEWLDQLAARIQAGPAPRFALHVCGTAVSQLLDGEAHMLERIAPYARVQLNFRACAHDVPALLQLLAHYPSKQFITQHNLHNQWLWKELLRRPNHQVLFDASGGRGITPHEWPLVLNHGGQDWPNAQHPVCGWAGGLGPENLATQVPRIQAAACGRLWWIDMENSLRDNADRFHLGLAGLALRNLQALLRLHEASIDTARDGSDLQLPSGTPA